MDMQAALSASDVLVSARPAPEPDWETALVRSCQGGDPDAFRVLVERYQRKVFSIAHSIVRQRPDVEDIAQQVFIKIYCAISKFDFRSALTTWIYRITINECYDYLRKQRSQRCLPISEISEAECRQLMNAPAPEALPDRRAEMAQIVALILEKLSSDERLLLFLKEVEGYSIQELAEQLGWNENTVKVRLFRVRRRLARLVRSKTRRRGQGGVHAVS